MTKHNKTKILFETNTKMGFFGGLITGIFDGTGNPIQYELIDNSLFFGPTLYAGIKSSLKFKKDVNETLETEIKKNIEFELSNTPNIIKTWEEIGDGIDIEISTKKSELEKKLFEEKYSKSKQDKDFLITASTIAAGGIGAMTTALYAGLGYGVGYGIGYVLK
jgi:hypothetical protein